MTGPDAAPPTPTDVVAGRYALCDPIGSGGSGTVWRAWDRSLGSYCAAKLLRRRDAGQLLRFVREQAVRLDGEHLASPYAWAAEDAEVLIASELVDGGSLHTLLGDYGPLAEGTVVVLLEQVLDALIEVHAAGLIHRDVKTGNVLLRATGTGPLQAQLTDFGLAIGERDARFTELGTVIGTPGYLAPEILAGSAELSAAQDLYAAGRLAVALLTGTEPRAGEHVIPSINNPELAAIIAALLATDPVHRPESATAARHVLANADRDPLPHTADGDEVDVLRQLPELPPGWDHETGPNAAVPLHEHHDPIVKHAAPQPPSPAHHNDADTVAVTVVDSSPAGSASPAGQVQPPGAAAPARPILDGRATPADGQHRWRPWVLTVIAAVVVGLAVYFIAAAVRPSPQQPPTGVTGTTGASGRVSTGSSDSGSTVSSASASTGSSGTVSTRASAATSSDHESPSAATTPASGAAPTAGQECSFQEENSTSTDPTGRSLQCRRTDGGYVWSVEG